MADDEQYRDQQFEYDEQAESSDDYSVKPADFESLYIVPSDWTISTIREQIDKGIDLDPEFQRRGVWNRAAKSRFIESLILGIPIPQILLSTEQNSKSAYVVLDGKQRLLAIKQFFAERFDDGTTFKLSDLVNLHHLNGQTWSDLQNKSEVRRAIENATIRTAILKGWQKEGVLYEIFYRLNSGSVKLSPMELRTALHRGPFLKHVIRWSESLSEIHSLLRLNSPDKRMNDVELAVRFLAFNSRKIEYRGNLKDFLDNYCKAENDAYNEQELDQRLRRLDDAISAARKVFGTRAVCRRWISDENRFDTRFNRAVFDIIIGSFANTNFRNWAEQNPTAVVDAFKDVCNNNIRFVTSIETTTKSITATRTRFVVWFQKVSDISQINIPLPEIAQEDDRKPKRTDGSISTLP